MKLLFYGTGAFLSLFLYLWLGVGFNFDVHLPLSYHGDVWLGMMLLKTLAVGDWFPYQSIQTLDLGAPFGMNLADFPVLDNFHFLLIKLISIFSSDPAVLYNTYFLSNYPLSTLTFMYAVTRFRVPLSAALVGGLLFSFLPFHSIRFAHIFLASYYLLPLLGMILLWTWSKKPLFFSLTQEGSRRFAVNSFKPKASIVLAFLTGAAGVYYAFFFSFFAVIAGISASLYRKSRYHLYSASILVGIVVGSVGLCGLPTFFYVAKHGKNPQIASRSHSDAEMYGLKLTHILLPKHNHRIPKLAWIRAKYHSVTPPSEGFDETVGIIAIIGFFVLLFKLISVGRKSSVFDKLSTLWVNGILLGTLGGFGVIFAGITSAKIRCYNRISVFLGLFGLLAITFGLKSLRPRLNRFAYPALLILILCIGTYDQITPDYPGAYGATIGEYQSDQEFVRRIEKQVPVGSLILQLPYMPFPENGPIEKMNEYSHLRGYLFSQHLRWSYGAIKGRPEASEIEKVSQIPLQLHSIQEMGYHGIYVDRFGFSDNGREVEQQLIQSTGFRPLVSRNQRFSFFVLSPS
jgi:phosphoglycerol transferase